jgi:L-amino acid N-acyltransferase YncA
MTSHATIRLADGDDAGAIREIYAPFCGEGSAVSFEVVVPTVEEIGRRIARVLDRYPWVVCEAGGEVVGYAYASTFNERAAYLWSVSTSVYVREDQRRRGIGRAVYTSLFDALRLQGYVNAYAGTTLPNPGSVGLHQAMGYEPVGAYRNAGHKGGAWHDVAWWHVPLREPPACPEPPLSLAEATRLPGWAGAMASGMPLLKL